MLEAILFHQPKDLMFMNSTVQVAVRRTEPHVLPSAPLQDWIVGVGTAGQEYHCQALNIVDAIQKCQRDLPSAVIGMAKLDIDTCTGAIYGYPDRDQPSSASDLVVNVDDLRGIADSVTFDSACADGRTHDVFSLSAKIDRLPGCADSDRMRMEFDDEHLNVSIRREGMKYVMQAEVAFTICPSIGQRVVQ